MKYKKVPDYSPKKEFYAPKGFFAHAASLRQAFAHCGRFSTAATRRCMGRVAVPLLAVMLSHRLPVIALVSHYPTNKLIGRRLFLKRNCRSKNFTLAGLSGISPDFSGLFQTSE